MAQPLSKLCNPNRNSHRNYFQKLCSYAVEVGIEHLTHDQLIALLLTDPRVAHHKVNPLLFQTHSCSLLELAQYGILGFINAWQLDVESGARLAAAVELGSRVSRSRELESSHFQSIASVQEIERWAHQRLVFQPHEELWALLLNGQNCLIGARCIAQGGVHACALTPGDVVRPLVREGVSAFVLVHNHPSGDPYPSPEDILCTRRIIAAADILNIALIDHVIVTQSGSISMLEAGLLNEHVSK